MTDWMPDWSGRVAVLVAGGSSATSFDLSPVRGRCAVGVVNNAYRLAPWADALYAADGAWWGLHKGAPEFQGIKIAPKNVEDQARWPGDIRDRNILLADVRRVELAHPAAPEGMRLHPKGTIGRGGNSGFQLLNLAVQFGARDVALVAYDFCGRHWHGEHPEPLRNPRDSKLETWAVTLDAQSGLLAEAGVRVVNCSPRSRLRAFPKMSLAEALDHFGVKSACAA